MMLALDEAGFVVEFVCVVKRNFFELEQA